jgi:hypothetical protein
MDKVDTKKSTFSETKNILKGDISMSSKEIKSSARKSDKRAPSSQKTNDFKKMREHLNLQRDQAIFQLENEIMEL